MVCLSVLPVLPVCLAVCCLCDDDVRMTHDVRIFDDLDLDELANDLPSDLGFLHKLCKFGGGMIKTDIVLHPYLLITQRGAFKMYIFHFKS